MTNFYKVFPELDGVDVSLDWDTPVYAIAY